MKYLMIMMGFWITQSVFAVEYLKTREEDMPQPAVNIQYDDGQITEVLVDEWSDVVTLEGERIRLTYQHGYNYKQKKGFSRTLKPDGSVYHEEYSVEYGLMVSKEEMIQAFEVFKSDPNVKKVMSETTAPVNLYGGFGYQDKKPGQPCYKGNRCLHIMASNQNNSLILHSIVKLNDQSVPYPKYDMEHLKRGKK